MAFYEYLLDKYGYNEPIMSGVLKYEAYSKPWIYQEMRKLVSEGKVMRFEKGVYYIPNETPFGKSILNPSKVINKKYITDGEEVLGYYAGIGFLNMLGLSSQMANRTEIYTNNEKSKIREVQVGNQKVILRRARTVINKSNAAVLSFLEMMNFVSPDFFGDEKKRIALSYARRNKISRKDITKYSPFFPDKAIRTFVESEIVYDVTQ